MVFLHEVECQSTDVRPTNDVDLVVDLRVEPKALDHTHRILIEAAFEQDLPSPEGVAHRYRRGGATIDVLAPDRIGRRAKPRPLWRSSHCRPRNASSTFEISTPSPGYRAQPIEPARH